MLFSVDEGVNRVKQSERQNFRCVGFVLVIHMPFDRYQFMFLRFRLISQALDVGDTLDGSLPLFIREEKDGKFQTSKYTTAELFGGWHAAL